MDLERDVERYLSHEAEKLGGWCVKFIPDNVPGMPDRLLLLPGGVTVWVENRGREIPPEKLAHVFEKFYRLDSARHSATGGAGLGLAIAKEIVALHQGSLRILDKEGPGLAVCLELKIEGPGHE